MNKLTVYGHYRSQPSRALLWLLHMKKMPFDLVEINAPIGEAETDEYLLKFPCGTIPSIVDHGNNDLKLWDSHAIMIYLCERHGWSEWYPSDPLGTISPSAWQELIVKRANVNQWLHWHHDNIRHTTWRIWRPSMWKFVFNRSDVELLPLYRSGYDNLLTCLKVIKYGAFIDGATGARKGMFLAGDTPTIADLACYCELDQMEELGLIDLFDVPTLFPEVFEWMNRMKKVECHDDVRVVMRRAAAQVRPDVLAVASEMLRGVKQGSGQL